jgi:hypothetical protein
MYSILTGCKYTIVTLLWSLNNILCFHVLVFPFFETDDVSWIQSVLRSGATSHIDQRFIERSSAEARLAEVIKLCWEHDADKRIDIFRLRDLLRQFVTENRRGRASPLLIDQSTQ